MTVTAPATWVKTHCQLCYNCCPIRVKVQDGKAVRIEGDPDNPAAGGRTCGRGLTGLHRLYDPYRVKNPLMRQNPEKGIDVDPQWKEVSWDEALTVVADKMRAIRQDNPNKFVAGFWGYEKYAQADAWCHAFGTVNGRFSFTGVSSQCANPQHILGMIAQGSFVMYPDLEHTQYLLMLGTGFGFDAHHNLPGMAARMAAARERGMKLVVVDPHQSTAASHADTWIPIRPATDLAFLLALIHVIVEDDSVDRRFLVATTNAPYLLDEEGRYLRSGANGKPLVWDESRGVAAPFDEVPAEHVALDGEHLVDGTHRITAYEALRRRVARYTPRWAQEMTTVPADLIRQVAQEFAKAASVGSTIVLDGVEFPYRPAVALGYRGMMAHANGGHTTQALEILNILVGAVGVPGGVMGKSFALRTGRVPEKFASSPDGTIHPGEPGWEVNTEFRCPPQRLDLWDTSPIAFDLPHLVPMTVCDPQAYGFDYEPEMLFLLGTNPLLNIGDHTVVSEALKKFDLVVDVSLFLDETTQFADLVLPEHSYLERSLLTNFTFDYVGLEIGQPVVDPLYNTMDGMELLIELADRAGFLHGPDGFNARLSDAVSLHPYRLDLERRYTWDEVLELQARSATNGEHDLAWFQEHGHNFRPMTPVEKYQRYADSRLSMYFELVRDAGERLREHARTCEQQRSSHDLVPANYEALPVWQASPVHDDPEFDLYMINYKSNLSSWGEANNPLLMEIAEGHPELLAVIMHEETAEAKGIAEGDRVMVGSRWGEMEGLVHRSRLVHPEVLAVGGSFGHTVGSPVGRGKGSSYNKLLPIDLGHTDQLGGVMESSVRVRVRSLARSRS